jgi:hypothetical protein
MVYKSVHEITQMELNSCPLDFAIQINRSQCVTVGIVTAYRLYDPGFQSRQRQISKIFTPTLWRTVPPIQWVPGFETRRVGGRGAE